MSDVEHYSIEVSGDKDGAALAQFMEALGRSGLEWCLTYYKNGRVQHREAHRTEEGRFIAARLKGAREQWVEGCNKNRTAGLLEKMKKFSG